jgi:peptidyl-tRNA hydrolase
MAIKQFCIQEKKQLKAGMNSAGTILKNRFLLQPKPFMNLEFQSIKELVSFRRIWLKT